MAKHLLGGHQPRQGATQKDMLRSLASGPVAPLLASLSIPLFNTREIQLT